MAKRFELLEDDGPTLVLGLPQGPVTQAPLYVDKRRCIVHSKTCRQLIFIHHKVADYTRSRILESARFTHLNGWIGLTMYFERYTHDYITGLGTVHVVGKSIKYFPGYLNAIHRVIGVGTFPFCKVFQWN
jgi:hypothetical protein